MKSRKHHYLDLQPENNPNHPATLGHSNSSKWWLFLQEPDQSLLSWLLYCRWSFVFEYLRGSRANPNMWPSNDGAVFVRYQLHKDREKTFWMNGVSTNPEQRFRDIFVAKCMRRCCCVALNPHFWPLMAEGMCLKMTAVNYRFYRDTSCLYTWNNSNMCDRMNHNCIYFCSQNY